LSDQVIADSTALNLPESIVYHTTQTPADSVLAFNIFNSANLKCWRNFYCFKPTVLTVVLMLRCCVRLSVRPTLCL